MKRILVLLMLAALGLGAASCLREPEQTPNGNVAVSFSVSTPKAPLVLTRAIASVYEWNIATLDIYAATEGVVEKLTADDFTISPALSSAPNQTYTVTLSPAWLNPHGGQTMNFYIVANDASSTNGAHTSLAATDEADFINALSEALTDNGDGTQEPITSPDGTTHNLLFSAEMPGVLIANRVSERCQLKRREARFDIQNKNAAAALGDEQLVITGIEVINAPESGLIFGSGDAATQEAIDRTKNITLPGLVEADYTETAPDSEVANDLATSVFYLYPTTLVSPGADATAGRTQIIVTGTYDGQPVKYPVEVPMETAIEANFRYILNVDATTASIQLVGDEYGEGGTIDANPINNVKASFTPETAQITGAGFWSTTSSLGNVFAQTDITSRTTMPFTVVSESGTKYTLTPSNTEVRLDKKTTVTTVTRATDIIVTEVFTVMIPAGEDPLEAMLVIDSGKDKLGNDLGADTIHIRRLEPVNIVAPTAPYLIYKDATTEALQLGKWDAAQVTQANIASFKFGGVVGMDMTTATYAASAATFNPMADSTAVTDAWTSVPTFVQADFDAGVRNVSDAAYHTYDNVMLGKGDPCKLVGLTEDQIKQGLFDNKRFRMPTAKENIAFVGGHNPAALGWQPGDADYSYTQSTTPDGYSSLNYWDATNKGVWLPALDDGTLNTAGSFLPAAGVRVDASLQFVNEFAIYRSSTPSNTSVAYYIESDASKISPLCAWPLGATYNTRSITIRCVPVSYVAPEPQPVIVGGLEWAPSNVQLPGQFAASPDATGYFYQWGQNIPWLGTPTVPATPRDGSGTTWQTVPPGGDGVSPWPAATNPCPAGWRVPTSDDFAMLTDRSKVSQTWVPAGTPTPSGKIYTQTGIEFADVENPANTVFFPAAGALYYLNAMLGNPGSYGYYWSASPDGIDTNNAYDLDLGSGGAGRSSYIRTSGNSVRCVRDVGSIVFVPASGVSLAINNRTGLNPGNSFTITATVAPADASHKAVTWSSSNNQVATALNGVVTTIGVGTATITATTVDGGHTATCTVTVNPAYVPVTDISMNYWVVQMNPGTTLQLSATINPSNATNKSVIWSSDDSSVARVSNTGLVTAAGPVGSYTTIYADSADRFYDFCDIEIVNYTILLARHDTTVTLYGSGNIPNGYGTPPYTVNTLFIESGITSISAGTFSQFSALTTVYVRRTTPPILGAGAFPASARTLYVPAANVSTYQNNAAWKAQFTTISGF